MSREDVKRRRTHIVIGAGSSGLELTRKLLTRDNVILIDRGAIPLQLPPHLARNSINKKKENRDTKQLSRASDLQRPSDSKESQSFWPRLMRLLPETDIWTLQAYKLAPSELLLTEEQPGLGNRQIAYAQGVGSSGTSNINAMIFTLGSRLVFDRHWPEEWRSENIDRWLQEVRNHYPLTKVRTSGNLKAVIEAAGEKETVDESDDANIGVFDICERNICSEYYASFRGGSVLPHAALALGDINVDEGRLRLIQFALIDRISFTRDGKANGVDYHLPANEQQLHAYTENNGEVILCAGAFQTPRILYDSIQAFNGDFEVELPGIGENLQDHVIVPYIMFGNWYDNWELPHGTFRGCQYPLNSVHGWIDLDADGNIISSANRDQHPSAQLLFVDGRISPGLWELLLPRLQRCTSNNWYNYYLRPALLILVKYILSFSIVQWVCGYTFGVLVCVTQPKSRGSIQFVSDGDRSNSSVSFDPGYLTDTVDNIILYNAFNTARRLVNEAEERQMQEQSRNKLGSLRRLRTIEVLPGPLFSYGNTHEAFSLFVNWLGNSYFHACGTCAMPRPTENVVMDDTAATGAPVLDARLRVKGGISNLRVADASAIPHIPNAPIQATCMVIGVACGEFILED